MQLPLTGYEQVELLRATVDTRVYAAVRQADGLAVVAKVVALGDELDALEARVEHEYALLSALDCEGVVRPLGLERSGDQLVLLLERVPGVDLATHAGGQALELRRFLHIAVQLATILSRVHAAGVLHRDIKPTNILIEAHTERVYLADFGISVLLDRARRDVHDHALIEGTLPYLSPEQTGRTKRRVDLRSDLYSLGVTFYELLTGRRPFEHREPLELIHAHLARQPAPLRELRPELPEVFERLVAKLMAKDPEARYQSARGLASDLLTLLARFEDRAGFEGLEIGASERTPLERFAPIREVRGRELERLSRLIGEAPSCAQAQLCVIIGEEGMGKGSLIDVLSPELTLAASHVGRGSFGAQREAGGRPYAALVEALTEIAGQLLTHSEAELGRWRARIERSLGEISATITELVPAFGALLDHPQPLPQLDPHAARNRVQLAFTRLCAALTEPARPLVLIIEQLERADKSSVALLEILLDTPACAPLLVLSTSLPPTPEQPAPLTELLERLGPEQLSTIELGPLDEAEVERALLETLTGTREQLRPLLRLLARKTNNNPRFLRQLLLHLVETEQLHHDEQGWSWAPSLDQAVELPDDFRELLARKLGALERDQAELLCAAACLGSEFELGPLTELLEHSPAALLSTLGALIELGLIDHARAAYRFAHPSVRDAALARLEARAAETFHWRIAQRRLERGSLDKPDELFALAEHLVAGALVERGLEQALRIELAQLLTRSGRLALGSAAYEASLRYLELALALLGELREQVHSRAIEAPHHALLIELELLHAQLLGVSGQVEAAGQAYEALLGSPLGVRERGRVAASWIALLHLEGRSREAVELGLSLLRELGCLAPGAPSALRAKLLTTWVWLHARSYELERLCALPACEDPRAQAVMEVLDTTKNASYVVDPRLYMTLIALHVRLVLREGLHPSAPLALAQLALSVGAGLGRVAEATALAERAVELAPRCSEGQAAIRTVCAASLFVSHLGRPFAEPIARMRAIYPRALEAGDLLWAGYAGASSLSLHLEVGTHLTVLRRLSGELERELGGRVSAEAQLVARGLAALTSTLTHEGAGASASQSLVLLDRGRIEAEGGSRYSVYVAVANLALLRLLLGSPAEALALTLTLHADMERVLFASWLIPRIAMTLIAAGAWVQLSGDETPPELEPARRRARALIARWARGSDDNYGHYLALVAGLRALERGRYQQAMQELERARRRAAAAGCRWIEGLSAEFLALTGERAGLSGYTRGALSQAWEAYEAWGARAKLAQLRVAHAQLRGASALLDEERSPSRSGTWSWTATRTRTASTPRHSDSALDYDSVLRSVASITTALELDEVIAKVLDAALTNAGSDHGLLALSRGAELELVAELELELERGVERIEPPLPLAEAGTRAPASVLRFVRRTGEALIVDDAQADPRFRADPFVVARDSRSLLALPLRLDEGILGVLLLENRHSSESFSPERFEALQLILAQAARALDHARTHEALRESELRWRSLVNQAPDLIALFDREGHTEFVNRNTSDEALPHTEVLARIARSAHAQDWARALARVLDHGLREELELELPGEGDQRSSWWVARVAPIEGAAGPASRKAIVIATEISQRKRAEFERARLQSHLRQQQRLESLGTLASGVAHEINNPVQGIMNYAELLEGSPDERELVIEFAHEIHVEAERVAAIVSSLLTFSRKERPQPLEPARVDELVAQSMTLVRSLMRNDQITLTVDLPEQLPRVFCRPQQLRQVLLNLLTNARDALNEAFPKRDPRKRISIGAQVRADLICLIVEDWGPGIPAEVLEHIFDPFFTTKGRDQGTGLGLSLALGIIQDHGGELRVDSRPGEGTRFEIELPTAPC